MPGKESPFKISLAQWSWHKRLFGQAEPKLDNLDFINEAHALGINAVEYVNIFFKDKAEDTKYLANHADCDALCRRGLVAVPHATPRLAGESAPGPPLRSHRPGAFLLLCVA